MGELSVVAEAEELGAWCPPGKGWQGLACSCISLAHPCVLYTPQPLPPLSTPPSLARSGPWQQARQQPRHAGRWRAARQPGRGGEACEQGRGGKPPPHHGPGPAADRQGGAPAGGCSQPGLSWAPPHHASLHACTPAHPPSRRAAGRMHTPGPALHPAPLARVHGFKRGRGSRVAKRALPPLNYYVRPAALQP
jgi:hypothetical protein